MLYPRLYMDQSMGKLLRQNSTHISACVPSANYEKSCVLCALRDLMDGGGEEICSLQVGQSSGITHHLVLLRPPQGRTDRGRPGHEAPLIETIGQLDSIITEKCTDAGQRVTVRTHSMHRM
jgi:hypothetical protein